ncbi:MAG: hypothetical protein ACK5NN_00725 [Sphingomonadaceae bacterium]
MISRLFPFCGLMFLAACNNTGNDAENKTADGSSAQGEVLGGTISDSMLPLDQLKSQSPPAKIESLPESEGGTPRPRASATAENGAGSASQDDNTANDGEGADEAEPATAEERGNNSAE